MDYELEIKKSIEIAVSGKPGPVWIDVPMDVQSQEVVCYNQAEKREEIVVAKNSEQRLDLKTMDLIFQKISISKRPILYIGPQIKIFSAEEELRKLSDILNIPIVTSWNAHDVIETSNEKYSGRPGLRGERAGNFNVYAADFILAIGTKLSIRQVGSTTNSFSPNSYKVMVDIDLSELDKPHLDIDLKVNLNPKEFISALVLYLKNSKYITPKNHLTWTKRAKKVWDDCRPKYHDYDVLDSINPYHFLSDFFTVLPENRVLVLGNGISVVGAFQMAEIKKNQLMFQNVGCASMGYDIPASIGASLGCGEKKVVCLTGDGSIQMNLQELQTIIGYDLNIAIFVINNGGYDSIKQSQISVFGKGVEFHGIDPDSGVTFPSLEKISIAYGYEYFKISEYENMESIAKMALSASRSICEVFVRHDQSFEPKVGISKKADGTIVGGSLINMNPIMQEDEVESILNFLRGQS